MGSALTIEKKNQVNKAIRKGVVMEEFTSEENLHEIYNLIQNTNNKKNIETLPSI